MFERQVVLGLLAFLVLGTEIIIFNFVDMNEIPVITDQDIENITHYAELKFSMSQIATMLHIDVAWFRLALSNPNSEISKAYNAGKLLSQVKRREAILKAANDGLEWAIKMLDSYEVNQKEEELMP